MSCDGVMMDFHKDSFCTSYGSFNLMIEYRIANHPTQQPDNMQSFIPLQLVKHATVGILGTNTCFVYKHVHSARKSKNSYRKIIQTRLQEASLCSMKPNEM